MLYRSRGRAFLAGYAGATLLTSWCGLLFSGPSYAFSRANAKTAVFAEGLGADLGEKAEGLAANLQSEDQRREWLQLLETGKEDWEDVKLVLRLLWQKAGKEGRDGGPLGYPMALARLIEGVYEGSDGDEILVADIDARLTQVPDGDPAGDPDLWKRSVALSCFKELSFVKRGL